METPNTNQQQNEESPAAPLPHGYTLADVELERVEQKRVSGNVLDPIALDDPLGQSVEKVIIRVGLTVILVIIAGILLAQVACKNIQQASLVDLREGVTQESVTRLFANGTTWQGETLRFYDVSLKTFDKAQGILHVEEDATSSRVFEQTFATAMTRSTALAVNAFKDPDVSTVVYSVITHLTPEGEFTSDANKNTGEACRITWTRGDAEGSGFACKVEGSALPVLTAKEELEEDK